MENAWLKTVTELGAFGVLAWIVYQTFARTLPRLHEEFRKELQEERRVTERGFRQLSRALERLTNFMLYHDAAVRGKTQPDEVQKLFGNGEEENGR